MPRLPKLLLVAVLFTSCSVATITSSRVAALDSNSARTRNSTSDLGSIIMEIGINITNSTNSTRNTPNATNSHNLTTDLFVNQSNHENNAVGANPEPALAPPAYSWTTLTVTVVPALSPTSPKLEPTRGLSTKPILEPTLGPIPVSAAPPSSLGPNPRPTLRPMNPTQHPSYKEPTPLPTFPPISPTPQPTYKESTPSPSPPPVNLAPQPTYKEPTQVPTVPPVYPTPEPTFKEPTPSLSLPPANPTPEPTYKEPTPFPTVPPVSPTPEPSYKEPTPYPTAPGVEIFGVHYDLDRTLINTYAASFSVVGSIPAEIGLLTALTGIWLYAEPTLTGSLPRELGLLLELKHLAVYGGDLVGSIPDELGELTNLEELTLATSGLTGTLPSSICALAENNILARIYIGSPNVVCSCDCRGG